MKTPFFSIPKTNYMPFIEWAMVHIQRIYEYWDKMDLLHNHIIIEERRKYASYQDECQTYMSGILNNESIIQPIPYDMPKRTYCFNDWLRQYYSEWKKETDAQIDGNKKDLIEAIANKFIIAIIEIRKSDWLNSMDHIEHWSCFANNSYNLLSYEVLNTINKSLHVWDDEIILSRDLVNKTLTEIIDCLFSMIWDDAVVKKDWTFIKSGLSRKPDLSFISHK